MSAHPEIYIHPHWDMNYFVDKDVTTGPAIEGEIETAKWDRTHSPDAYAELFCDGEGKKAVGEKTADLFFWQPAHKRMAAYVPACRFIVILRNPVERAWSHYWNEVGKKGRETLGFEEALAREDLRTRSSAYARNHFSYLARGFYERNLRKFYEHIPADQVLIITTEEMRAQPIATLQKVYRFIDVDPDVGLELAGSRHNENATQIPRQIANATMLKSIARSYNRVSASLAYRLTTSPAQAAKLKTYLQLPFRQPARQLVMPREIRAKLQRIYEPHIEALEALLGRQLGEWKLEANASSIHAKS
jgi:sulfotransferase family protein